MTVTDLKNIIKSKGNITIDLSKMDLSTTDLKNLAKEANKNKVIMTIKSAGKAKSVTDLKNIAKEGNRAVVFEF